VPRGDERYILRFPEEEEDRSDRFCWTEEGDLVQEPEEDEAC
jgi:hypothetical protein